MLCSYQWVLWRQPNWGSVPGLQRLILCELLIGLRNTQTAGKTSFQSVSETGFLEEVSVWIGEPNKVDESPQDGWISFHPLRAQTYQKGRGGQFSLSAWASTSIFSCPWTSALCFSDLLVSDWITPPAFLFSDMQTVNHETSWTP